MIKSVQKQQVFTVNYNGEVLFLCFCNAWWVTIWNNTESCCKFELLPGLHVVYKGSQANRLTNNMAVIM